jgi:thioredoxin-like negative regulator of GroEL
MLSPRSMHLILSALLLAAPFAVSAQQQVSNVTRTAARLEPTTSSQPARDAFRAAWFHQQNVHPAGAQSKIAEAVAADPQLGVARAFQAFLAPGSAAERERRINEAMSEMRGASTAELLLALYWRELAGGRATQANELLGTVAAMLPQDPEIAWQYVQTQTAPSAAERVRSFLQVFPQHAAAQNTAAYAYHAAGDRAGSLVAAEQYLRLAPDHINSHDTYADILLLHRRLPDALTHIGHELAMDPQHAPGLMKRGVIRMMQGDVAAARADFTAVHDANTTFTARAPARLWLALSHLYARQPRVAVRMLGELAGEAQAANAPGWASSAHGWAAVIDAYTGQSRAVAGHLDAARIAQPDVTSAQLVAATVAYNQIGDAVRARESLAQLTQRAPNNPNLPLLNALVALRARDLNAADAELADVPATNLLGNALRAELLLRQNQRARSFTLRDEVLASSIKTDGNPNADFMKLVARLHAQQLR